MKAVIFSILVLVSIPAFAKTDNDFKNLTPPSVSNWEVTRNHTKDYDEMTDEVFKESDMTSIVQKFKVHDSDTTNLTGIFSLLTMKGKDSEQSYYRTAIGFVLDKEWMPINNEILVRFDKAKPMKFSVYTSVETGEESYTTFRIADESFAQFVDLCKKSSKMLVRIEDNEATCTFSIDLANFTKVMPVYEKNIPAKE